ncbi:MULTISPECIES: ribosome hibernation promoting factor [Vibrio]|jgi:putative sigma-54 modulation protein|uniref:Ribosome hibernation promoting factor n=2 Tax=Vibrio oreintalis group TaxID=1891919 RepID=A0A177XYC8_9VIBR|nr:MULTISPECIES: ribosome hibernation promoting factor [Vibrio]AIW12909.1 ribosome hibernation promoting factor HPF [Vibrio tubiashii ATCC 19109]EGU47536.1 ribosome hibernation protein YhbH [Vibrio tubiashii ATCC 19109]EIF04165.1 ribosome hibernation protein YhbH [Vibrio tubiashii NCIMB 1337 = ATCC 19106]KLN64017.1 ribosome hibernation promoting factor HPF [Vibrio sp. VPAP30]MCG9577154.1 ribosome hibernation promoting factor [Vibrio tubiashii]
MQININGHHVDLTDSMQDYVNEKFQKLERFFDHINSIHVVLKVEKLRQIAEATLHVNQAEIHASSDDENMYAAIDSLVDKLVRQLNKHKEKLNAH